MSASTDTPNAVEPASLARSHVTRPEDMIGMGYFPDEVFPPPDVSGRPPAPPIAGGSER